MKVLVVDPQVAARDTTARFFLGTRHEVLTAPDARLALLTCAQQSVDVVVVELKGTGWTAQDVIKGLRSRESTTRTYVIVTSAKFEAGEINELYAAGADDFVRKPLLREELIARVEGLQRIRAWAVRMFATAAIEGSDIDPLRIEAWRNVDAVISSELGDMLGQPLDIVPGSSEAPLPQLDFAVKIALNLPAEGYIVKVLIGMAASSMAALGDTLLGAPDSNHDDIADALRELANVGGGALKRVASSEGKTFVLGLPSDIELPLFGAGMPKERRRWTARTGNGIELHFDAQMNKSGNEVITVSLLREGMVLARDLVNSAGTMLIPGGTRLTQAQLDRVTKAVNNGTLVEVAHAA